MKIKNLVLQTAAASITMWVLAGLWHNLVMPSLYRDTHASHEGIFIMLLAYTVLAAIMSIIYARWYTSGTPWIEGLKFGAMMGVLWVFPYTLTMAGAHGTSIAYVFKNAAWHMVEQGAGGIAIGLLSKGR